jgi:hypothetical protein
VHLIEEELRFRIHGVPASREPGIVGMWRRRRRWCGRVRWVGCSRSRLTNRIRVAGNYGNWGSM